MKSWKRLGDLLLEVVIAVVVVTAGIIYVVEHPTADQHWDIIALLGNTAIVFGFLISWFRDAWKSLFFWSVIVLLLLGHMALYLLVLHHIQEWPLTYYVLFNTGELVLFTPIIRKLVSKHPDNP